jgi:transposase
MYYLCLDCETEHNGPMCPNCGSEDNYVIDQDYEEGEDDEE